MSDSVENNGVGNQFDQVGRYFMEHPHGRLAHIETKDPQLSGLCIASDFPLWDVPVAPALVIPPSLQRELGILNSAATFKLQKDPSRGAPISKRVYMNLKARFVT